MIFRYTHVHLKDQWIEFRENKNKIVETRGTFNPSWIEYRLVTLDEVLDYYGHSNIWIKDNNNLDWIPDHQLSFELKDGHNDKSCSCSMTQLMREGCNCGSIQRYRQTYK